MAIRWPAWFKSVGFRLAVVSAVCFYSYFWGTLSITHRPVLAIPFSAIEQIWRQGRMVDFATLPAGVLDRQGVLSVADMDSVEVEAARTQTTPGTVFRGELWSWPSSTSWGLAAPVLRRYEHVVRFIPGDGQPQLTPTEFAVVRPLYVSGVSAAHSASGEQNAIYPRLLASGDGTTTLIHWGWLLHDLCILALLVAVGVSYYVGSIAPWREKRRLERAVIALGAFRCPSCGYSIAGLAQGNGQLCPECGRELVP
ncbi:MAG: hypothetical protein IT436_06785 [Phycisphaerales bacterium]|nr:hypothetical protein [Phycisphaerales bacterium]